MLEHIGQNATIEPSGYDDLTFFSNIFCIHMPISVHKNEHNCVFCIVMGEKIFVQISPATPETHRDVVLAQVLADDSQWVLRLNAVLLQSLASVLLISR